MSKDKIVNKKNNNNYGSSNNNNYIAEATTAPIVPHLLHFKHTLAQANQIYVKLVETLLYKYNVKFSRRNIFIIKRHCLLSAVHVFRF